MTSGIPPTEQDFELLSTYLDSQLAETLRTQLESRLATEPA
jgi:anti-sigma factor RsiW